ncbi:hypothetical protein IPG36_06190 [bacterium]|nr:MAG: hypothetical protein IPG36_06190 [bacterium]
MTKVIVSRLPTKQFDALALDGAKELEVVVSDFQTTVDLLAAIGITGTAYQESRRENWRLGDVDIMIDEWPWLVPYIEIEADEPAQVQSVAEHLVWPGLTLRLAILWWLIVTSTLISI